MSQEPKYKALHKYLKSNNLTDLDEATFLKEYSSNDKKFTELHNYLQSKKLTDLDANQFKSEYFSFGEKKNDIASSTSTSTPKESPTQTRVGGTLSVGGKRMITPPSDTSGLPKTKQQPKFRLPQESEREAVVASIPKKKTKAGDITTIDPVKISENVAESKKKKLNELTNPTPYKQFSVANQPENIELQTPVVMPSGQTERQYLEGLFSKRTPDETIIHTGKVTLEDIGIDVDDFEGYILSKGIADKIVKREKEGSYESSFSKGSDLELQKEVDVFKAIQSYISEQDQRLNKAIELGQEINDTTIDFYSSIKSKANFTKFNQEKLEEYVQTNLPNFYKKTKENEEKTKEKYNELLTNGTGLYNEKTGTLNEVGLFKDMASAGFNALSNRLSNISATIYDKIGIDDVAEQIRMSTERKEIFNSDLLEYSYVQGKKVKKGDTEYIVDDRGGVYDITRGINVTNILDPLVYRSITDESKKSKEKDWSFNPRGTAIQTTGVVGDVVVQVLLTAGSTVALGNPALGAAISQAPMAGSIVTQSLMGYSSMYEETLKAARSVGLSDSEAEFIANDAGIRGAGLYAITSVINPQMGAVKKLLGVNTFKESNKILGIKSSKEAADNLMSAYKKGGMKDYSKVFKGYANRAGQYTSSFVTGGTKEVVQEDIQQVGEIGYINKPINLKLNAKILNEKFSMQDFMQTSILSFISSGVLEARVNKSLDNKRGSDKESFMFLVKSASSLDNVYDVLKDSGRYKDSDINSMIQDVKSVSSNLSKIPQNVINDSSTEKIIAISNKMSDIKDLELDKSNVDPIFHEEINNKIAKLKEELTQIINKDEREVPKQEGKQPEDSGETISAEVKKDDLQPQEKVVEEGAEPVSDVPLLEKQVEDLRKEEIAEFNKEVENPESFITDGKVDANKVAESDNAKAKEIYAKYDAQIKPLLDNIKTQEESKSNTKGVTKEEIVPGSKAIVSGIEITYPTAEQETERKEARSKTEYVEESSKELDVEDTTVMSKELEGDFGILTAENPMAKPLTEAENVALNKKAKQWLESRGYKPRRLTGKYTQAENSFFVPNLSKADAIAFAKEFNQDSVAHSEGLIYQDGSMNPRVDSDDDFTFSKSYDAKSDNVSVVRTKDGLKTFSVGYDFNQKVSPNKNSVTVSAKDTNIESKLSGVSNKKISGLVAKAAKSIAKILPNIKFVLHNTNESFIDVSGESKNQASSGLYQNGEIHINLEKANARTVAHEVFHAILLDRVKTDSKASETTKRMLNAILPTIDKDKALKQRLEDFADNYDENIQDEEKLAELVGILAENYNSLSNRTKEIIKNWLDELSKLFGIELFESNEVLDVLNAIAKGVATGKEISKLDMIDSSKNVKKPIDFITRKQVGAFDVKYTEQDKLDKLVKDGLITEPEDTSFMNNEQVAITSPDDMLVGTISIDGKEIFEGGGGVFFVTKYGDVWASGKEGTANTLAKAINNSLKNNKSGKGYLVLTKGSDSKLISSSSGVNSSLAVLESMLDKNLISLSDFRSAVSSSIKTFGGEISLRASARQMKEDINNYFSNPKESTFQKRGDVINKIIESIAQSKNTKDNKSKIIDFLGGDATKGIVSRVTKNNKSKNQSLSDLIAGVASEKLTKGLSVGDVYAIIEVNGDVVVKEDSHPSYPFHVVQKDGKKPILHLPKLRENGSKTITTSSGKPYSVGNVSIMSGKFNDTATRKQKNLPEKVAEKLTEDEEGNFVFKHYSDTRREVIKKGKGENRITSREESSALSSVNGLAMFYTMDGQVESGVGNVEHTVLVSKDKVYDIDSDPLGFEAEARNRFEKIRPNQAFSNNYRAAFITQVANENGFDLAVTQWRGSELRGQTTLELKPEEKNIAFKDRPLPNFEAGDMAIINGVESVILNVDGVKLSYESLDGKQRGVTTNNERNRRSIIKLNDVPVTGISKELSEKIRGLKTKGGVNLKVSIIGVDAIIAKIGAKIWNEAMEFLATEVENGTAIGVAVEKTSKKITELLGNSNWEVSKFKSAMKQHLSLEAKKETISELRDALGNAIETAKILTDTRRIEEKNLKTAKNKVVQEIVKRFEGVLPKGAISGIIKAVNKLNSRGDIGSQLDSIIDSINDILNKDKADVRVKESINNRKKGVKNFKKGGYSIDSTEAKIIFMNPKIVFKLGEKIFNAYFDALNQISTNAKVSPKLSLSALKAIYDNNLLNKYIDLSTRINESQILINERVEALIDAISQEDADVNDLIKEFKDSIDENFKDIREFLDIPSENELKGVDSESDTDLIKAEEKEILINLIKDDINTVVKDITKIAKDVNSKLYQHIKFLQELGSTSTGEAFLNSLNNTALNNLYNAVLNLKETNESGFYINELNNKYQQGINTVAATNVISDASKKGGVLDSFIGKAIGKALAVIESVQIIGSSETIKGVTNLRDRLMRNLLNANLPRLDKVLGNDVNNNLYKSLFDSLSKAISKYVSIIKPIMNKLDDLQVLLERSKDVEVSNVKLVFHSLSVMKMSNLTNKKIGNIVEHFKHTIEYHRQENPDWAKTLQKIFDKHIVPFIVKTDVKENADGTITIDITAGDGVKDGVNIQTKDNTGNLVNQKVKLVNGKASITIKTPITYENYLVVTPNNYLSPLEQKVYNETRDILKGIESMSKEAMVMQNGRMNQMSENYVPMASHSGGSSNLDKVIDSLISSIDRGLGIQESGTSVPDSGNLLPLQSGNKALKMSYIQNIKGVAKGVALQHSVKDEVIVAVKTAKGIMKEAIKSGNETQIEVSSAIKQIAMIAIKNSLMRASIPNLIMSKIKNSFYTLALAVVQSRAVDFTLNNLRYAIVNPKGYFNIAKKGANRFGKLLKGKRPSSDMQVLSEKIGLTKEETIVNLVKNMKASDSAGLISSDLSSTMQGVTSDKTMRADSTREFYSETAKFFTKINSIFFKNSIIKHLKGINTVIASISDTALKRDIFFEEFNSEFKKETGNDIDFEKMAKGDVKYISENQKAINKASTLANAMVSIMSGSSNPLERTLRTNIQVGSSTLESLRGTVTKPDSVTKYIDNVDVLFAGFMRSIYAQYKEGLTDVVRGIKDGNVKQVRVGSANVIASSATVALYKPIVTVVSSAILTALTKAFVYDEEEKEDAERVEKALDSSREDKELIDLLFRLQQVEDIEGFNDEHTGELKIKESNFLLNKMYENKAFRDVLVFKTSQIIYESVMLQIKNKANVIADELITNPLSTKGRYEVKNYTNPQNIINTLGYLYSEEGSKEPNVEEDRRKMKEYLKEKLLTGTSFSQFEGWLNQFEDDEKGFKNAYILETAKMISKYKTTKEILISDSFSEFLNFNLGATGGNLGRTVPSLFGHTIEKYIYEESRKPFDDYNPEVVLSEKLLDELTTPAKKSELLAAYIYTKLNPATSSVLKKGMDATDFRDEGVSMSKLLSLFLVPGGQDANKIIKESKKDPVRSVITKDMLKSFMFGKKEKDFEDLDFDMMDISEITRTTRDTLRSAGDKKFGGN
jgi:hypothetical protein